MRKVETSLIRDEITVAPQGFDPRTILCLELIMLPLHHGAYVTLENRQILIPSVKLERCDGEEVNSSATALLENASYDFDHSIE